MAGQGAGRAKDGPDSLRQLAGAGAGPTGVHAELPLRILAKRLPHGSASQQAGAEPFTPSHGRNELFRLTSLKRRVAEREFWASLPASSKAHLVLSGLAAASVLVFCVQQLVVGQELLHAVLAELVSAVFFVWFAAEAVYHENAFELLAQAAVALCIGARVIFFLVSMQRTAAQTSTSGAVLGLLALSLCMALASYSQFGWRLYSRVACDLRQKDGRSKQKTYLLIHVFTTMLKLDTLVLLILFLVGVATASRLAPPGHLNAALLALSPLGLLACACWSAAIFFAARNDWGSLALPLAASTPLCLAFPVLAVVFAYRGGGPPPPSRTSLVLAAAVFSALRLAAAALMQVLVSRFRLLHHERVSALADSIAAGRRAGEEAPPELQPLLKGAWIGKPSAAAPRKRRFFQLSSDGSCLRWAWDKYVLLYYVEAQENDDAQREIRLRMVMEPDLVLRFDAFEQYLAWRCGLESVRALLEQPGGVLGATAQPEDLGGGADARHGMVKLLLLEQPLPGRYTVRRLLKQAARGWSGAGGQRRSEQDPKLKHFHATRQRAHDLHALGVRPPRGGAAPLAGITVQGATPASRHKRGVTVPSIQEIIDAIAQQEQSPDRPLEAAGGGGGGCGSPQLRPSFTRRWKELVIDCISPDTKKVRLRTAAAASPSGRPASRVLFSDKVSPPRPPPPGSQPSHLPPSSPERQDRIAAVPPAPAAAPSSSEQVIESRERLDTVSPLPPLPGSRPPSAALLKSAGSSPTKPGEERAELVFRDVPAAAPPEPWWEAARRGGGDALHPLIQRTRTQSSSSGSFYGASPLHSQAGSGAFPSDGHSQGASLLSQSTYSSSASVYSNGPLKMSVPFIPIGDVSVGRCLGEGSEGAVYAGSYLETPVAIKQLNHVQEMEMNLHIGSHDNVVALRGISRREENLVLVMEYCPKGTLHLLLHSTAQCELDAYKLVSWVRAIARGMLHLHTRKPPILHRDLKPANIFVGHGFVMKIGDFGMSRHVALTRRPDGSAGLLRQLSSGVIGTACYAAPELLEGAALDAGAAGLTSAHVDALLKSDVYSFGVTLWEMLTRKRPFGDLNSYQIHHAWMVEPQDMQLPPVVVPPELPAPARKNMEVLAALVAECTQPDPTGRPSFHDICLRLKHLPPRSSSVLNSPMAGSGPGSRSPKTPPRPFSPLKAG